MTEHTAIKKSFKPVEPSSKRKVRTQHQLCFSFSCPHSL